MKYSAILNQARDDGVENVEQYIEDVELLVENNSFEHAFALSIVAEEELVKAFFYDFMQKYNLGSEKAAQIFLRMLIRGREAHARKIAIQKGIYFIENLVYSDLKKELEKLSPENFDKMLPQFLEKIREKVK